MSNLPPCVIAWKQKLDEQEARQARALPQQLQAPPAQFTDSWHIEFTDTAKHRELGLRALRADERFDLPLIGYVETYDPTFVKTTITVYAG